MSDLKNLYVLVDLRMCTSLTLREASEMTVVTFPSKSYTSSYQSCATKYSYSRKAFPSGVHERYLLRYYAFGEPPAYSRGPTLESTRYPCRWPRRCSTRHPITYHIISISLFLPGSSISIVGVLRVDTTGGGTEPKGKKYMAVAHSAGKPIFATEPAHN